jgi:hypothetical protein
MGTNPLIGENPDLDDLRRLEETIYEFNVQATGIMYLSFMLGASALAGAAWPRLLVALRAPTVKI